MSNGIEIIVQIRAQDTETKKDVPTYYTAEETLTESFLDEYDSGSVVEAAMETPVRRVVAEYMEDHKHE